MAKKRKEHKELEELEEHTIEEHTIEEQKMPEAVDVSIPETEELDPRTGEDRRHEVRREEDKVEAPKPEAPSKSALSQSDIDKARYGHEIIRGKMPVACAYMMKYGSMKDKSLKELSMMFATTYAKTFEIVKLHKVFAHAHATFKPTSAMKAEARIYLDKHPLRSEPFVQAMIDELNALPEATTEEAALYEATKTKARQAKQIAELNTTPIQQLEAIKKQREELAKKEVELVAKLNASAQGEESKTNIDEPHPTDAGSVQMENIEDAGDPFDLNGVNEEISEEVSEEISE